MFPDVSHLLTFALPPSFPPSLPPTLPLSLPSSRFTLRMEVLAESGGMEEKEEGIWPAAPAPWEASFVGTSLDPLMLDPGREGGRGEAREGGGGGGKGVVVDLGS